MMDPIPSGNMESLVCVQYNCRRWSRKIGIRSASRVAAVALWITRPAKTATPRASSNFLAVLGAD
jgi:hypothetical protein